MPQTAQTYPPGQQVFTASTPAAGKVTSAQVSLAPAVLTSADTTLHIENWVSTDNKTWTFYNSMDWTSYGSKGFTGTAIDGTKITNPLPTLNVPAQNKYVQTRVTNVAPVNFGVTIA